MSDYPAFCCHNDGEAPNEQFVGQTSRSVRMGLQPTNRDENPAVGQALGPRRPLRPPGRAFNNLRWVFDRARVLQDALFATGRRGRRPQDWSPALRGHAALRDSRRMRRQSDQEWPYAAMLLCAILAGCGGSLTRNGPIDPA